MMFGNDGKLYITTGDAGTPENAQDRKNNLGKLIRLEDDGSIPDDNPYSAANGYESYNCQKTKGKVPDDTSDDAICSEIFALDLRNPFRMSMDPNEKEKTRFAISDVGGKVWEEINYAGTDYMAVNYGHKEYEGPCFRQCDQECPIPKEFEEPFYWYHHNEKQNGCVAGSVFVPVTDENGLVAHTNRIIQPTLIMVDVKSNIPGSIIHINDEPTIPDEVWGWKEQEIRLKAENKPLFLFESWSDGVRDPERVASPNFNNPAFEAIFCVDEGGNCLVGPQTCCIGACNVDGICSVAVELPPLWVRSSPTTDVPATESPTPLQTSDIFDILQLNDDKKQYPSSNIGSAGKAMLSITCLLISGIITSFLCMWKCSQQTLEALPPPNVRNEEDNHNGEYSASLEKYIDEAFVDSATSNSSDDVSVTV